MAVAFAGTARATLTFVTKWGSSGNADGQFQQPLDIAVDSAGNVYVDDSNNHRIQKFTADGTFILKWGSYGSGPGQIGSPQGLAVDRGSGAVYVADSGNYRLMKFDSNGTFIQQVGQGAFNTSNPAPGEFTSNPRDVAVAPNGDVYATENGDRVLQFTASGSPVRAWGTTGSGPGQFYNPRGVAVDPAGNVYIADASNSRIQKFTADGTFLSQFGSRTDPFPTAGPGQIAIAPDGHIFVAEPSNAAIVEFAADGTAIERTQAVGAENFVPAGLAIAPAGDLYIGDNQANTGNRVLELRRQAAAPPPLPDPVVAKSVNVAVQSGTVLVKRPAAKLAKGAAARSSFVPLTGAAQIPVGSFVDTTRGQVGLTSAAGLAGQLQQGSFSGGQFQVTQRRATRAFTDLRLSDTLKCATGRRGRAVAARSRRSRHLFGNAHGRFRTRGRYSTATVRGTQWVQKDTCSTTTTIVKRGTVIVRDLAKRRNVTVRAGKRYVARKRTSKRR